MKTEVFTRRKFLHAGTIGAAGFGLATTVSGALSQKDNTQHRSAAATDNHSNLEGLLNDDHLQYLNETRGDARYHTRPEMQGLLDGKVSSSQKDQVNGYPGLDENGKLNPNAVGNFVAPTDGQPLMLRDGVIISVSETYRRLDTEFGVIADGVTNNAAAIQAAMNVVRDSGGGTIVFPNGVTRIEGSSSIDQVGRNGPIRVIGSGGSSVVHIAGATAPVVSAFSIHNCPKLTVENLTFIGSFGPDGTAPYLYDCEQAVFSTSWVEQVTFRDCEFLGISINAPYYEPGSGYSQNRYHGIIACSEGDVLIERCIFGGCATNQCPNVGVTSWNGLTIRDSQFLDYGYYRGITVAKTAVTNTWWVRAINQKPISNARMRDKVKVENTIFDEANATAVMVYGAQWVDLDSISVNGGLGPAFCLVNVNRATIKDSFVGYINTM